jgi:signal recognition particle subunit SRP54
LALRLKKDGRKPLLCACDLVRPAAVEQLSILGEKIGVPVFKVEGAKDSSLVYRGALDYARKNLIDTIIIDSTGRLQIDEPMMEELKRLKEASKPDELLLVADSMTGQSAVDIASVFNEKIGLTGVVLTKFDSDTRGGAALSLRSVTGCPLKFVGMGEKPEDLEPFHPERAAGRILGMGDVVSLVEKAQEVIDQEQALELQKKITKETLSLEDWLEQLRAIKKMGSLKSMIDMIPGMAGQISEDDMDKAELGREEAMLSSMTRKERANYLIIGPSRRARIARGSGTSVAEVARFIKKFEKMRSMMKKMSKAGKAKGKMGAMMGNMGINPSMLQGFGR